MWFGAFNKGIVLVNPLKNSSLLLKYDSYKVRIIWVRVTKTPSLPLGWVSLCEVSGLGFSRNGSLSFSRHCLRSCGDGRKGTLNLWKNLTLIPEP